MVARILGVISGLVLLLAAAALWRPEWFGNGLASGLTAIESVRSALAIMVVICGGAITIAAALPVGPDSAGSRRPAQPTSFAMRSSPDPKLGSKGRAGAQGRPTAAALAAGRIAASVAAAESAITPWTRQNGSCPDGATTHAGLKPESGPGRSPASVKAPVRLDALLNS